jgi:hypothetical protein
MEMRASLPLLCLASWAAEAIFACHVIEIHKQIISAERFPNQFEGSEDAVYGEKQEGPCRVVKGQHEVGHAP